MITSEQFDVCVIGGGPAGTAAAIRLAQLGHRVILVDRGRGAHRHSGESLSPGIWTLFDLLGAWGSVERGGFRELRRTLVDWDGDGTVVREFAGEPGLLVDRACLAAAMREVAAAHGVHVRCPAAIRKCRRARDGWEIEIEDGGSPVGIAVSCVLRAGGRRDAVRISRRRTGPRTLALYGAWRGGALPDEPQVEAGADAWYWGMPLPDGGYSAMVFVDPRTFREDRGEPLVAAFVRLIGRSNLLRHAGGAVLADRVGAADATPFIAEAPGDRYSLRIGEAALAIDPLSSSGVQRAMQSGVTAAIVVNTLQRRPGDGGAALAFYRDSLAEASDRHRRWAAERYRAASITRDSGFWRDRAAGTPSGGEPDTTTPPHPALLVALAAEAAVTATPCIVGDYIELRRAVRLPGGAGPVAFVAGQELAPLLDDVRPGMTAGDLVRSWSGRVAPRCGIALVAWMMKTGVLVTPRAETAGAMQATLDRGAPWQIRA